jgi:FkbM family methyltransferase
MPNSVRPLGFIIAATDHGTMIVNRFDRSAATGPAFGVGYSLLRDGVYESGEITLLRNLLDLRRKHYGDGVVAVDCGANVGVHTIELAKHMTGWGTVLAFEAQERVYYALAGNIAINNCFNARAINAAVSNQSGTMKIPQPNYLAHASFGSLELRKQDKTEFIGQEIDYSEEKMVSVPVVHLDALNFPRLDLIKIDVEGMEIDVLAGAAKCIGERRPILFVEALKNDQSALRAWLEGAGYSVYPLGQNFLALHQNDKSLENINFKSAPPAAGQ